MLALLAGGSASTETQRLLRSGGTEELVAQLGFFGLKEPPIAFRSVSWEDETWSRGAYAVFDAKFPLEARRLLKKPFGRVFFAGEHTSAKWQGYMNGAVASGRRAAEEITVSILR
jgi:monoamine oxidase